MAPTGSSSFSLSIKDTANTIITPAMAPIKSASEGFIWSAPAVIPTKPPRIQVKNMVKSSFLSLIVDVNIAATPPAAAAKQAVTKLKEVNAGSADKIEPPLNPNQPNHKINTPAVAKGKL